MGSDIIGNKEYTQCRTVGSEKRKLLEMKIKWTYYVNKTIRLKMVKSQDLMWHQGE